MFFKILKLFGVDVQAKIDAAAAGLELRVERVSDHVKQVARDAAIIAALSASATITGAMAAAVGLIALYRWTAERSGAYSGLEVDGALLLVVTCILAAAAVVKRKKSLQTKPFKISRLAILSGNESAGSATLAKMDLANSGPARLDAENAQALYPTMTAIPAEVNSPSVDVLKPLAFFLSKVVRPPSGQNQLVDELFGSLGANADGTPEEAIGRAADVIRRGDRGDLVIILTGAAFVGWLLTRQPMHKH